MRAYLDLLRDVLENGVPKGDRTGTGTLSVFGRQMRFDLAQGLSLGHDQEAASQIDRARACCGFSAATPISPISSSMASPSGMNGPMRKASSARSMGGNGAPGRRPKAAASIRSPGVSTRSAAIPNSRRLVVSAWNPADLAKMALAPCHCLFQFYVLTGADGVARLPASSTSARETSSSACPSISRAMRFSRI